MPCNKEMQELGHYPGSVLEAVAIHRCALISVLQSTPRWRGGMGVVLKLISGLPCHPEGDGEQRGSTERSLGWLSIVA